MVLTWPAINYPTNIKSILGIWITNYLILTTDMEMMGWNRCTREGHDSLCLRDFPKENLTLTHYMIIARWLHSLDGILHYIKRPGEVAKILVMTNNITELGYTYANRRLKNPPGVFCKISHIFWLMAWIPSRLAYNPVLWRMDRSLLCTILPKDFNGTNNQDTPTDFDTSMSYTLWDSGCAHSINPYIELYTE